jgi:sugar lactone lactonase YvrE
MNRQWFVLRFVLGCLLLLGSLGVAAQGATEELSATQLASGLGSGSGSTVGPDGALYVGEPAAGVIARVDPATGEVTEFASGLPKTIPEVGVGGIMDVLFVDGTAYALVTLIGEDVGGADTVGIYRIDESGSAEVVVDIGAFSLANPPKPAFFVPTGVQYSFESYDGGFIVADGHHNRVLWVTLDGDISEVITFENIVPTGLEVSASSSTIYLTEAGPVPHLPENGKVMAIDAASSTATQIASGARLMVDVEYGSAGTLYALSQGDFTEGNPEGSPANPNTGSLVRVNADGTVTVLASGLNQPTSLEIIGDTAYVVTLGGEVWTISGV